MAEKDKLREIKKGDKVRHRASGEVGIVTNVVTQCNNPEHKPFLICVLAEPPYELKTPCQLEVVGYAISTGFGKNYNYAKEIVELIGDTE
jgi:hypothetical protein